ncbi:hypothetical protein SAMN06297421_101356, partial [Aristaeella hokkaidonensis]|uniref:hypothetical protein n=1 Tax=Aristaeella hokkaidonensis TaxID=3046382 RepID=UPI000B70B4A5
PLPNRHLLRSLLLLLNRHLLRNLLLLINRNPPDLTPTILKPKNPKLTSLLPASPMWKHLLRKSLWAR